MSDVFYNKYRPATFADVAQPHIVRVLQAEIALEKTVSAYIFSGPSGVGKTTVGRIVAMALNCSNRKPGTSEPCGTCSDCVRIRHDNHRDVIEIDCAKRGKVEDIREVVEERLRIMPESNYRVFIMDEAHMITTQGQNTLLKPIEEPPDHVKFIIGTSEPHKLISAIRTRCHKLQFSRVANSAIQGILEKVVEQEGIEADEAALQLITFEANGSAREALALLQHVSVIGVTEENVRDVLLRSPKALAYDVLEAIGKLDRGETYRLVDAAQKEGRDMTALLEECARILMTIARYKVDKTQDVSKADPRLIELARAYKAPHIVGVTSYLIDITTKIRQNVPADLAVQVGILKIIDWFQKNRESA